MDNYDIYYLFLSIMKALLEALGLYVRGESNYTCPCVTIVTQGRVRYQIGEGCLSSSCATAVTQEEGGQAKALATLQAVTIFVMD